MFRAIFAAAVLAGLIGGLAISVVQEFTTTPIILHAEEFESKGDSAAPHRHGRLDRGISLVGRAQAHDGTAAADGEAWAPQDGIERTLYTTAANLIAGVGFALILVACYALSGRTVTGREGVIWGLAGFGIVSLAPALGLPPEVPGAMAAELTARQGWWLICAVSTAAGLWMMVFRAGAAWIVLGIVLIAAPHVIGAPQPERIGGAVPPELAGHFAAASLVTAAIFWSILGWLSGTFWKRFAADA